MSSVDTDAGSLRDELLAKVLASPPMIGADLSAEVSTPDAYRVDALGEHRFTVAALDYGIKAMTPHRMAERGITPEQQQEVFRLGLPGVGFVPENKRLANDEHAVFAAMIVVHVCSTYSSCENSNLNFIRAGGDGLLGLYAEVVGAMKNGG